MATAQTGLSCVNLLNQFRTLLLSCVRSLFQLSCCYSPSNTPQYGVTYIQGNLSIGDTIETQQVALILELALYIHSSMWLGLQTVFSLEQCTLFGGMELNGILSSDRIHTHHRLSWNVLACWLAWPTAVHYNYYTYACATYYWNVSQTELQTNPYYMWAHLPVYHTTLSHHFITPLYHFDILRCCQ